MRADAVAIFKAGLDAVTPGKAVLRHCLRKKDILEIGNRKFDLNRFKRIFVVGAGKAAAAMAGAVEGLIGDRISAGLISVKYSHTATLNHIETIEAGHPIPDENGLTASRRILELVHGAGVSDLVIVLISGGGSALLPLPDGHIRLADKQAVSDLLIASGAGIHDINAVRKHISGIKGGRLAQAAAPAAVVALILSDVVGNNLDVIASGPTVPDATTFDHCRAIIERHGLSAKVPPSVVRHLRDGALRRIPETPDIKSHAWDHVFNLIVADNRQAIAASADEARKHGYHPLVLSTLLEGETRVVASVHGAVAREILVSGQPVDSPACLLSGGETTVTIRGKGKGGRNQEFALAAALDIDRHAAIVVLSAGTDGTDGPTDAAGALADHTTVSRAHDMGLDCRAALDNNNAYPFFKSLGDLLMTGPTLTNVMDMHIVLVINDTKESHATYFWPDKP
jgi:hydroxypyruvate reductase